MTTVIDQSKLSVSETDLQVSLDFESVITAAFSGDGKLVAVGDYYNKLTLYRIDTKSKHELVIAGGIKAIDLSKYGSTIVIANYNSVMIYTWTNGNLIVGPVISNYFGGGRIVKLARDLGAVFYVYESNRIQRTSLEGMVLNTYEFGGHSVRDILFTEDGKSVLAIDSNGNVRSWTIEDQMKFEDVFIQQMDEKGENPKYYPLAISRDLTKFAAYTKDQGVIMWQRDKPTEHTVIVDMKDEPREIAFSHNGEELLITQNHKKDWVEKKTLVVNIEKKKVVTTMFNTNHIVFSNDGKRFLKQKGDKIVEIHDFK